MDFKKKICRFINFPYVEKKISLRRKFFSVFRFGYGKFGKNSDIYKPIMIYNKKKIYIGNNVLIRNGARIEAVVEWNGIIYNPRIIIGDNVTCEQNLHITCANEIIIEKNVTITPNVMITDINHCYQQDDGNVLNQQIQSNQTIVGEGTFIGKNACIMPGVTIGKRCVIGANAVVTKDIPDNSVAVGIPAKVIKKIR